MKRNILIIAIAITISACSGLPGTSNSSIQGPASATSSENFAESATPTPFAPVATPESQSAGSPPLRIVAYYPYWRFTNYPPAKLPAENLDVINYEFALPTSTGDCFLENLRANQSVIASLLSLKDRNPNLRIVLSIGGVNSGDYFESATANPDLLNHFAETCVQAMNENNFDGIDVNWETSNAGEYDILTNFLAALRQRLDALGKTNNQHYLLTMVASADGDEDDISSQQIAKAMPLVDWVNLISYDFYDNTSKTTGLNAPLFTDPGDEQGQSIDSVVQAYLSAGLPSDKLVLGVSFTGQSWKGVQNNNNGLYQPFKGTPNGSDNGSYSYSQIKDLFLNTATRYWDDASKVPWLYDPSKGVMVSYDDAESIGLKVAYARDHGLGGVMISEITADDENGTLTSSIISAKKSTNQIDSDIQKSYGHMYKKGAVKTVRFNIRGTANRIP